MLTAVLTSTMLDLASGQLTCTVRVSLGGTSQDFSPVVTADRLATLPADWSTEDVLGLLSSDCGFQVTAACA